MSQSLLLFLHLYCHLQQALSVHDHASAYESSRWSSEAPVEFRVLWATCSSQGSVAAETELQLDP